MKAVFLKLGTINVHHKRNKMAPLGCCHGNSFATGVVLIKTENLSYGLKRRTIYPTQSIDGSKDNMRTMSVQSRTLCLT